MKVIYNSHYNIDLGLLNYVHPFDGTKFRKIHKALNPNIDVISPASSVDMEIVDDFLTSLMRKKIRDKVFIFRALEVPKIPLISFSFLDKKVLTPMRWSVAGTVLGAESAVKEGGIYWNLSGGYHHAMQQNMEGFCIYNDVGIAYQQLIKHDLLSVDDKILIIDTDAHHGNGNAYTFMDNDKVTLLDVYNEGIYPSSSYTRERVDIAVPLSPGTDGEAYLKAYGDALARLDDDYRLAFVVAGTDPLMTDRLGKLGLTIEDICQREQLTLKALTERSIATVMLGGGGYSKESAISVAAAINHCSQQFN